MSKKGKSSNKAKPMTTKAASRIQSATAKSNSGQVSKGSFASRAQSASAKNASSSEKSGTEKK